MSERFTWAPAPGPSQTVEPRVRSAPFGDGYQQRVGDGINNQPRRLALNFNRATADVTAIDAFLAARGAEESFDYLPTSGADGKWICKSWSRVMSGTNVQSIMATFEEVYGD